MSANLNSMMYVGDKPWHGMGTKLNEVPTSAQAINAAGLNWKVYKRPMITSMPGEVPIKVKDHFAVVREDTRDVLGVVGGVYTPLQNADAFKFFDAVVGEKAAMYHTAGSLGLGERVWILAKLPGYIRVTGDDVTEKFLLLSNTHDGTGAVQVFFTPIRVVCQNTLNIALGQKGNKASLRHTFTLGTRVNQVRDTLGIMGAQFSLFEDAAKALAHFPMNYHGFKNYVAETGLIPKMSEGEEQSTRAYNIMEEVSAMFEHGKGNDMAGVKGTAWAGFNAVAEYVDYKRTTRGDDTANRAKSLLFGSGAAIKQKAWDKAIALIQK